MSVFDHPIVSFRYFFPDQNPPPSSHLDVLEINGHPLNCARLTFNPDWPWLLYFHGNGEVVSNYVPSFAPVFEAMGANVFFAEYRGFGGSSGTPKLAAMLDDALQIADTCGIAFERMIPFGRSVGSIFAIEVASKRDVAGLIIESGIADVLERILLRASPKELGTTPELMNAEADAIFNHQRKLEAFTKPSLFLHTQYDTLVDSSHAQRLHQWSGDAQKQLVLFSKGGHNDIFYHNQQDYIAHAHALIQRCLS